ncbi:hypothetical protein [Paenibacillus tyrfis]|uniref:hypothetical protein n=1 Tax=Paenibacillus tyrfis TaxID=1501230 RepID=UPI0020A01A1A|nr:hypothetical protein [Paenibacillus tyrfis]MCP1311067.1 hypothetical protein [Paenibacillus tyrfis]
MKQAKKTRAVFEESRNTYFKTALFVVMFSKRFGGTRLIESSAFFRLCITKTKYTIPILFGKI